MIRDASTDHRGHVAVVAGHEDPDVAEAFGYVPGTLPKHVVVARARLVDVRLASASDADDVCHDVDPEDAPRFAWVLAEIEPCLAVEVPPGAVEVPDADVRVDVMRAVFGEPISTYSRAQALEDGELVDLAGPARGLGFVYHVAITRGAYATAIELTDAARRAGNDVAGRTHDVLWMLRCAIGSAADDRVSFELRVVRRRRAAERVVLCAVCGPGDNAEPVITIMLPEEV